MRGLVAGGTALLLVGGGGAVAVAEPPPGVRERQAPAQRRTIADCKNVDVDPARLPDGPEVSLRLDGKSLTVEKAFKVLTAPRLRVSLAPEAAETMRGYRRDAVGLVTRQSPPPPRVYGWNQALGPLKDKPISPEESKEFQNRVLASHGVATEPVLPGRIARLALVIRANQMARGHMGVRPELPGKFLELVNKGVTPVMPQVGSLGSGDLQPMAVAGQVVTGTGGCASWTRPGQPTRVAGAADILRDAGIAPAELEMGEALPIMSGSTVVAASALEALHRGEAQADLAEGGFALFMEALRAEAGSLDTRTHDERQIPEQKEVVARLRGLVDGSEFMTDRTRRRFNPQDTHRVQDAVSVRAAPHILASLRQNLNHAEKVLTPEMNASTSNPLIFRKDDGQVEFVMGGNWDGAVLGHSLDALNAGLVDAGVLSQELSARLLSSRWSYGLPANLAGGKVGLNSGMVQLQTVATALIPEMQVRAFPSGTLSRPAKDGQEDHNTMAMASARNLRANQTRLDTVLAVQYIMSAQGVDLVVRGIDDDAADPRLGAGTQRIHDVIRTAIAELQDDRNLTPDLEKMVRMVNGQSGGALLQAVRGPSAPS
ncbi:histidine ammonia-lyase [Actinomadura sp. 1N219]|uniref:histidine ammonia-lyase n=1 Tax=Actinomadura sp. 1N219 TaxID=3375152 RepID=UPI003794BCA6